jgi:two-component system, response regulator PdtaR
VTILNGKHILIVEADFLIALDIQRILEAAGVGQTVFARTSREADALRHRWPEFDLAIVEIAWGDVAAIALAEAVSRAGIGLVVTSSHANYRLGAPTLAAAPVVQKPFMESELVAACRAALAHRSDRCGTTD